MSAFHVCADNFFHGKAYVGIYIPGIRLHKHSTVQKTQENDSRSIMKLCQQAGSLLPAYSTSRSAA